METVREESQLKFKPNQIMRTYCGSKNPAKMFTFIGFQTVLL